MLGTMALDEITEKLYYSADASTLLGLLPLLRSQIEHMSAEMKHLEHVRQEAVDTDAKIAETYSEALAKFDARIGDDPGGREAFRKLRDKVNSPLAGLRTNDAALAQRMEDLFKYVVDLMQRERWIIDEMKRRGYLPMFAGEEPYL